MPRSSEHLNLNVGIIPLILLWLNRGLTIRRTRRCRGPSALISPERRYLPRVFLSMMGFSQVSVFLRMWCSARRSVVHSLSHNCDLVSACGRSVRRTRTTTYPERTLRVERLAICVCPLSKVSGSLFGAVHSVSPFSLWDMYRLSG